MTRQKNVPLRAAATTLCKGSNIRPYDKEFQTRIALSPLLVHPIIPPPLSTCCPHLGFPIEEPVRSGYDHTLGSQSRRLLRGPREAYDALRQLVGNGAELPVDVSHIPYGTKSRQAVAQLAALLKGDL